MYKIIADIVLLCEKWRPRSSMVEQRSPKPSVGGSNPSGGANPNKALRPYVAELLT